MCKNQKNIKEGDILNGLIKKRREAGLTQSELAEKINVSQPTIAMWENGGAMPTAAKLPHLAEALNCTIDELFGRTEESEV